ncbi:HAMP domain-containing sensor histidine kinase [Rhodococcus chondri]|uniref:histidine kinase n=1 Tax=Rhodococcus chondri TaxID=3065941 RepID=A0ABU7JS42_9NOCA|nr:HAMP domain-containing sensor histidine kinase [Rhodococcus sp. CC-R104]MEE2032855.1 HAMP domain-containing sensor histidine kinase [Rhodococcus sp. CC-R104]
MIRGYRLRRRLTRRTLPLLRWSRSTSSRLAHTWRRSLQLRVVVSTLSLSLIVMLVLGVVLTSQITDRLLEVKINAATEEMERSRALVEGQLAGADDSGSLTVRLDGAAAMLTNRGSDAGSDTGVAGMFDPVLIVPGDGPRAPTSSGPADQIPQNLRAFVQNGQIAYQFATVADPDGYTGPALIVGSPTESDISTLELYLVFPLGGVENTLALVRGTLLVGAGVDDMARLAMSFNEMAESLSRQITQLEEYGNRQKRFTSDVSHELRTPLTTVRMAADLIHDGSDELGPTLKRASELLVAELDRFEGLLGDLLEISRHDAGVAELASEQLDLRMCARAAVSTVRHLARESSTELIVDLPDEPVTAEVDPRRVERILRNLLANAIDHGDGKPVLLRLRADDNAAALVVRAQGIGLHPGEEKLVFNRFWRSDPSRVRRSGGTGLGLAISVEDANLHNGKLEAWGEPGKGASFRLTLPRERGRKVGRSPLPLVPSAVRAVQGRTPPPSEPQGEDAPAETEATDPVDRGAGDSTDTTGFPPARSEGATT